MKCLAILVVCVVGAAVAVPEGYGHYVPKAYYYLDPYGQPSAPQQIHPDTLNRVRRQIQPFQPFAFPNFAPLNIPQGAQGSSNFVSSSLNSRFGEEPVVTGQSSFTTTDNKGQTHHSTTYLRPDGSTYTQNSNTRPKRQTQQQGQSSNGGNQQQSQSQNGGSQNQFQSQNGGGEQTQFQSQNRPNQQASNLDNINQPAQPSNVEQGLNENLPDPQFANTNLPGGQPQQQQPNPQVGGQQANPQTGGQPQVPPFGYNAFPFPQQPAFPFPQQGFAPFPQFGFPTGGFGAPGFGQPAFGGFPVASPIQPGQPGTNFQDGNLHSRFGEDGSSFSGGSTVVSSNNNGVVHTTTQSFGPDGKVHTTSSKGRVNDPTSFSTRISDDGNSGVRTFTSGGSTVTTNNNGVVHSTSQTVGPDGKVRTFSSRFNDDGAGSGVGQHANFPTNSFTFGYPGFPQTFNTGYAGGFSGNSAGLVGGGISTRSFTDDDGNVVTETKRYGPDGKVIETRKS